MRRYWICHHCATEQGATWPKDHVATFAVLKCDWCGGLNQTEQAIAPYVDYNWPNKKTAHLRD